MKCLVVDDEPLAIQLMASHIARIDILSFVKSCNNAMDALAYMRYHPVDLLFLDIKMPRINGISLLQALQVKPKVIITTAFRDYAFDAFDLDVTDYLLKPISFERFLRAISKVTGNLYTEEINEKNNLLHDFNNAYVYLRQDKVMVKIYLKDIQYIESLRDYIKVITVHEKIISYNKLNYIEKKLPENKFKRIHRSFIVALDRVKTFTPSTVKIDEFIIPIGRNFKNEAIKAFNRNNIFDSQKPL